MVARWKLGILFIKFLDITAEEKKNGPNSGASEI